MADKTSAGGDESDGAVNPKTSKVNGMGRLTMWKNVSCKEECNCLPKLFKAVIQHGNEVCCYDKSNSEERDIHDKSNSEDREIHGKSNSED